jgi:hypothetical protein
MCLTCCIPSTYRRVNLSLRHPSWRLVKHQGSIREPVPLVFINQVPFEEIVSFPAQVGDQARFALIFGQLRFPSVMLHKVVIELAVKTEELLLIIVREVLDCKSSALVSRKGKEELVINPLHTHMLGLSREFDVLMKQVVVLSRLLVVLHLEFLEIICHSMSAVFHFLVHTPTLHRTTF